MGRPLVLAALAAALVHPIAADALAFKVIDDDGNRNRVLLVYDCELIARAEPCQPHEQGFDEEDPARLKGWWSRGPFAEVWLVSGGGDLAAGIKIANDLRAHQQAVRVPNVTRLRQASEKPVVAPYCVSSCTVAFMGGQFRTVDMRPGDAATYEVHAASSVSWNNPAREADRIKLFFEVLEDPTRGLAWLIGRLTSDDRATARDLFTVFQDTLWLSIKKRDPADPNGFSDPERRQRDGALSGWVGRGPYVYSAADAARDSEILRLEGRAALQDILMRVERDSMHRVIAELRQMAPGLGRRADAAVAMLAAMYETSSILETNNVPKETLTKMGYLTEFVR
jgi:hypothetical protein